MTVSPDDSGWPVVLTDFERRIIRQALAALRYKAERKVEANKRKNWQPEPGKFDLSKLTIDACDALKSRIPFPERREE